MLLSHPAYPADAATGRPDISAGIDRQDLYTGDRFKYTITIKSDEEIEVTPPDTDWLPHGVNLRDYGTEGSDALGSTTVRIWYLMDSFIPGIYNIPAIAVSYRTTDGNKWQSALTTPVDIQIKSVLAQEASGMPDNTPTLRDIKGPVSLPLSWKSYALGAMALAALAALAVIIYRRYQKTSRNTPTPAPPPRPPYEVALEALNALIKKDLVSQGQAKEHYFELTDILRQYLEARFALRAPEMTTEEFMNSISRSNRLKGVHKAALREFLSHCDMVKFARYTPGSTEVRDSYACALNLVKQTRPQETPQGGA